MDLNLPFDFFIIPYICALHVFRTLFSSSGDLLLLGYSFFSNFYCEDGFGKYLTLFISRICVYEWTIRVCFPWKLLVSANIFLLCIYIYKYINKSMYFVCEYVCIHERTSMYIHIRTHIHFHVCFTLLSLSLSV